MPSPARHGVQHGRYNDGEGENLMKKVKPLENKLSNNKTCPSKNN